MNVAKAEHDLVVRMADGEDLLARLGDLPVEGGILCCGIGMLRRVELGYWNGTRYETHRIDPPVELVSLQGTLARFEGRVAVHAHASVALPDGTTRGGHLFAGTVHNTAEIAVRMPPGISLEREKAPSGLTLLLPHDDGSAASAAS